MHVMFFTGLVWKLAQLSSIRKKVGWPGPWNILGVTIYCQELRSPNFIYLFFSKALNFKVLFSWRYRRSPETRFPTIETEHSDISACWLLCWHFVDCDPPQYALLIPIIRLYIFSMHYGWVGLVGLNVSHNSATDHIITRPGRTRTRTCPPPPPKKRVLPFLNLATTSLLSVPEPEPEPAPLPRPRKKESYLFPTWPSPPSSPHPNPNPNLNLAPHSNPNPKPLHATPQKKRVLPFLNLATTSVLSVPEPEPEPAPLPRPRKKESYLVPTWPSPPSSPHPNPNLNLAPNPNPKPLHAPPKNRLTCPGMRKWLYKTSPTNHSSLLTNACRRLGMPWNHARTFSLRPCCTNAGDERCTPVITCRFFFIVTHDKHALQRRFAFLFQRWGCV